MLFFCIFKYSLTTNLCSQTLAEKEHRPTMVLTEIISLNLLLKIFLKKYMIWWTKLSLINFLLYS